MFKFIAQFFAPKTVQSRPMAIRRKRINPTYFLQPESREHVCGSVGSRMTEVHRGNDVSDS